MTTAKDLFATIPEEPAAEAAGTRAEEEAADKPVVTSDATWQEADFSFEDAPAPPSRESLTSGMGRKNLTAVVDNPEDADSEMQDADVPAAVHPSSSSKRKGRSTSQGGAKKRAIPLKSPRSSSAGPKVKAAPVAKPVNKIPRAPSPPAKAAGSACGKTATKGDHPFGQSCCTESSADSSHRKATTEQRRLGSLGRQRRPRSLKGSSSRMSQPQRLSHPLFAVDWSRFASREAFLAKTSEVYKLDPNSAEGFNCHVTSYYYVSSDWGVSHPQSYSSIMLKNDSRQSHRWTCVHCRPSHPECADHKTVEEGIVHWWRHHCHPACWVWCEKATAFGVTTAEVQGCARELICQINPCHLVVHSTCSPTRCHLTPRAWIRGFSSLLIRRL